jgi:short-subunit dehydrogenase involved in D-alanine esterification of teichoic acids
MKDMTDNETPKKRGRAPQVVTSPRDLDLLREVTDLTIRIHSAQNDVTNSAKKRRELLQQLRSHGVTFRVISENTGISENGIWKDLAKS